METIQTIAVVIIGLVIYGIFSKKQRKVNKTLFRESFSAIQNAMEITAEGLSTVNKGLEAANDNIHRLNEKLDIMKYAKLKRQILLGYKLDSKDSKFIANMTPKVKTTYDSFVSQINHHITIQVDELIKDEKELAEILSHDKYKGVTKAKCRPVFIKNANTKTLAKATKKGYCLSPNATLSELENFLDKMNMFEMLTYRPADTEKMTKKFLDKI